MDAFALLRLVIQSHRPLTARLVEAHDVLGFRPRVHLSIASIHCSSSPGRYRLESEVPVKSPTAKKEMP